MLRAAVSACAFAALAVAATQPPAAADLQRFVSRSMAYHIDLPPRWRQLAPREASRLRAEQPQWPAELHFSEPTMMYAVGPVDDWLQGRFDGVFLYVVEQGNEWLLPQQEQLQSLLQRQWDAFAAERERGVRYEIGEVQRVEVGTGSYPAVQCQRRHVFADAGDRRSLDTYLPTGGRELSLVFSSPDAEFAAREPQFRQMLATLALARPARGAPTAGDHLWTPVITGAAVGIALWILYRWTRRRV